MEFKVRLEAVCNQINNNNKMIESVTSNAKKVDEISEALMDSYWSGKAKEQFKINLEEWQSQMGKFLEETESMNKSFSEILNKTTIELQKRCDSFIGCIKK